MTAKNTGVDLPGPLRIAVYLLPFVFAIHNFEESLSMAEWSNRASLSLHPTVTTLQFAIAVSLFTLLGFLVIFLLPRLTAGRVYQAVICAFAGMLWLNVFFPHLLGALYLRSYTPGLVSALVLNLPLSSALIYLLIRAKLFRWKEALLLCAAGGISGALLAWIFLAIGKIVIGLQSGLI